MYHYYTLQNLNQQSCLPQPCMPPPCVPCTPQTIVTQPCYYPLPYPQPPVVIREPQLRYNWTPSQVYQMRWPSNHYSP